MTIEFMKSFFMWSTIINYAVLLLWFFMLAFMRDTVYRLHGRWFPMSKETFMTCHYVMYGLYKLAIIIFNFVPFLVLTLLS